MAVGQIDTASVEVASLGRSSTDGATQARGPQGCLRIALLVLSASLARPAAVSGQPGELIERTLAIVGGQAITLSDVRTASALQLIDAKPDAGLEPAVSRLIDRVLMLREVQRYVPTEPDAADVDRGVDLVRRRFASPDALASTLAAGGFTEARLRAWLRDDLRIAAYLAQRFAAVGVPTDEEVASYYDEHRAEFDARKLTEADAVPVIRERIYAERRAQLIADWVEDLRRRTPIVELWKTPPPLAFVICSTASGVGVGPQFVTNPGTSNPGTSNPGTEP